MQQHAGDDEDNGAAGEYASPPCYMHELDPFYFGLEPEPDEQQRRDVARWRKAERERLIAARLGLSEEERRACDARIAAALDEMLGDVSGKVIAGYVPIRGEPDLREWLRAAVAHGATCALPVAQRCDTPLVFCLWQPGTECAPEARSASALKEARQVLPDIVITPVVGFDSARHRLGYGDGLLDRTLAAVSPRPHTIGVAYASAAIPTIYPQPHDIALDVVITEQGYFGK